MTSVVLSDYKIQDDNFYNDYIKKLKKLYSTIYDKVSDSSVINPPMMPNQTKLRKHKDEIAQTYITPLLYFIYSYVYIQYDKEQVRRQILFESKLNYNLYTFMFSHYNPVILKVNVILDKNIKAFNDKQKEIKDTDTLKAIDQNKDIIIQFLDDRNKEFKTELIELDKELSANNEILKNIDKYITSLTNITTQIQQITKQQNVNSIKDKDINLILDEYSYPNGQPDIEKFKAYQPNFDLARKEYRELLKLSFKIPGLDKIVLNNEKINKLKKIKETEKENLNTNIGKYNKSIEVNNELIAYLYQEKEIIGILMKNISNNKNNNEKTYSTELYETKVGIISKLSDLGQFPDLIKDFYKSLMYLEIDEFEYIKLIIKCEECKNNNPLKINKNNTTYNSNITKSFEKIKFLNVQYKQKLRAIKFSTKKDEIDKQKNLDDKKKVATNELKELEEETITDPDPSKNIAVLDNDITTKLKNIKSIEDIIEEIDKKVTEINDVFINPIDNDKIKKNFEKDPMKIDIKNKNTIIPKTISSIYTDIYEEFKQKWINSHRGQQFNQNIFENNELNNINSKFKNEITDNLTKYKEMKEILLKKANSDIINSMDTRAKKQNYKNYNDIKNLYTTFTTSLKNQTTASTTNKNADYGDIFTSMIKLDSDLETKIDELKIIKAKNKILYFYDNDYFIKNKNKDKKTSKYFMPQKGFINNRMEDIFMTKIEQFFSPSKSDEVTLFFKKIKEYNDKIFMDIHDILQSSEHKEKAANAINNGATAAVPSNNPFITKLTNKIKKICDKSSTNPPNLNKLSKESNHTMILPYTDVIYMYFLNLLMYIYQLKNN